MPPGANGDYPFRLDFSGGIAKRLRQLQRRASRQGRGGEFLEAFRKVVEQLRQRPFEFGEPLYRLPALRLLICCAVVGPFGIDFAISEDHPVVFIRSVRLLTTK